MKDNLYYMPITIGGIELKNPFVVASGPTTKRVDQLELAEREGWAAVSVKLTMIPDPYIRNAPRYRWLKKEKFHTFTAEYRLDVEEELRLAEAARRKCREIVIMANYACVEPMVENGQGMSQGAVH